MGSIRKGQVAILEELKKLSELVYSNLQGSQTGVPNPVPEKPSQNLEQSMKPTNQQSNQPSTSQQSFDLDLEERETRELLDSLSSHDDLSISASSVFSANADPDLNWAQPSHQPNLPQSSGPTTTMPFYPAPSTSVALPFFQANPASSIFKKSCYAQSRPPSIHSCYALLPYQPRPFQSCYAQPSIYAFYALLQCKLRSCYPQPSPPSIHSCYALPDKRSLFSIHSTTFNATGKPSSKYATPSLCGKPRSSVINSSCPVNIHATTQNTPPRTGRPQNGPFTPKKRLDEILSKYTLEKDAGRATNQLAELYFLGPKTMATNTVSTLDKELLKQIKGIILSRFGRKKSVVDQELLWSRCRTALGQRCKNIHSELRKRQF